MKPPKSIRKIVNSFIGKRTKSSLREPESLSDDYMHENSGDNRRRRGSEDDLTRRNASDTAKSSYQPRNKSKKPKSESLPRRSKSCNNFRSVTSSQIPSHQVSCNEFGEEPTHVKDRSYGTPKPDFYNAEKSENMEENVKTNSVQRQHFDKKANFRKKAAIQRTTSLNSDHFEKGASFLDEAMDTERQRNGQNSVRRHRKTHPHSLRRTSSAIETLTSRQQTDEKLQTCRSVLDRLAAQVQEMKDISRRSGYADDRNDTTERHGFESGLRIPDLSLGISHSLKSSNAIRHSGSNSNGCYSEQSTKNKNSRLSSNMNWKKEPASSPATYKANRAPNSGDHRRPQVSREDSNSSGYATGSGSEDGRQESPNTTDRDSILSHYAMQNGNCHQESRQALTLAWKNQHFNQGSQPLYDSQCQVWYDPYSTYYPDYHGGNEPFYQTYGEIYGYASSSGYDDDIRSNAWYQIHHVDNRSSDSYGKPTSTSNIKNSYWGYSSDAANAKYGGLADLFYDPTATPRVSLVETIANEVAMTPPSTENTSFKTYGSFRYRNGQRTVTVPTNSRRKMVRFSQTVHQRVETEGSETEDSTSTIKGCADEESDSKRGKSGLDDSETIYAYPPHQYNVSNPHTQSQQQNYRPEPIYEFPSGHIESSCMCSDCILARNSCQMQPTQAISFY